VNVELESLSILVDLGDFVEVSSQEFGLLFAQMSDSPVTQKLQLTPSMKLDRSNFSFVELNKGEVE
jgi:hypothetical protein